MALAGLILGYTGTVITTMAVLAAIAIPNYIAFQKKAFCSQVEAQAYSAAAAIECYISDPSIENLPAPDDLASDPDCGFFPSDAADISISGTIDNVVIIAADMSRKCPNGETYTVSIPANYNDGWQ